MKILNLFAGIGGNRLLWGNDYKIIAIEHDKEIANIYKKRFPKDDVFICDAYEYFIKNFQDFNFIWASPPCPTHSNLTHTNVGHIYKGKKRKIELPDMRLYGLILFLQNHFRGNYIVENVKPYYKPLIPPTSSIGRHIIWSNVYIPPLEKIYNSSMKGNFLTEQEIIYISKIKKIEDILEELNKLSRAKKIKLINNCVIPEEGKYIFDCIIRNSKKQQDIMSFF